MENSTSPHHGGNISSQYPPATEQPEEECSVPKDCVVDLRADSFASVCQVVTENQVLQAKLAASEARVKALEAENEALREIVSESCAAVGSTCRCSTKASLDFMAGVPGEIRMTVDALQERVKALEEALQKARDVSSAALARVDKLRAENKALEAACQK